MSERLTATLVPYSSIVGSSISIQNEAGAVVAILMITVPSPRFDYRETAEKVAAQVLKAFDANGEISMEFVRK